MSAVARVIGAPPAEPPRPERRPRPCRVPPDHPAVAELLDGLGEEYRRRLGGSGRPEPPTRAEFMPPAGAFVVIHDEHDHALAGGGIRPSAPGAAEVKRIWTHPAHRRRGHARSVLEVLEREAARLGYDRLRLVTHVRLPEALALYDALGYAPVAPFTGPWRDAAETRWLGKAIGPAASRATPVCAAAVRAAPRP